MTPRVSVLMSVFNGELYLRQTIESILEQTLIDFEFVIVDDASTDHSLSIVQSYDDSRIRVLVNEDNIGLTSSLNRGLASCGGEYVARIDADDLAAPRRLEEQVAFLDSSLRAGLVGTWFYKLYEDTGRTELIVKPTDNDALQQQMLYSGIFAHSTVLFRRRCIRVVGAYNPDFLLAQDKDLWLRVADRYRVGVIPLPLATIRVRSSSLGRANRPTQNRFIARALEAALKRRLDGATLWPPTAETIGRSFLYRAYLALSDGELEEAQHCLETAFERWPTLCEEVDDIVHKLAYTMHNRWLAPSPRGEEALGTASEDLQSLTVALSNLSPPASCLASRVRQLRAAFHIVAAFAGYRDGDLREVPRHCLIGAFNDPSWLRNPGVWSIFGEAVLGSNLADRLRAALAAVRSPLDGLPFREGPYRSGRERR